MPTETAVTRETWLDWQHAEAPGEPEPDETDLMSRSEFIARLNRLGADVDEGDLRFWEYQGVLPRATKRWHDGANRVFYPPWMLATVVLLRELQRGEVRRAKLNEIAPILRMFTGEAVTRAVVLKKLRERNHHEVAATLGGGNEDAWVAGAALSRLNEALLDPPVIEALRRYRRLTGTNTRHAVITLLDDHGGQVGDLHHVLDPGNESD